MIRYFRNKIKLFKTTDQKIKQMFSTLFTLRLKWADQLSSKIILISLTVTVCSFPSLSVTLVLTGTISLLNAPVCCALPALSTLMS